MSRIIQLADDYRIEIDGQEIQVWTPELVVWCFVSDSPVALTMSLHTFDGETLAPLREDKMVTIVDKQFDWGKRLS